MLDLCNVICHIGCLHFLLVPCNYMYVYYEDNKKKTINSVDLKKLEKRVKEKGLKWIEIN